MSGKIKFFHPDETFVYHVDKCFCKVIFSKNQKNLIVEIESTEELDHVEEDSLQNEFPKVIFNIDDFPVEAEDLKSLEGKSFSIESGTSETENEDGETEEVYYTNLNVNEEYDFETNQNTLQFSKKDGVLHLFWKGVADDFTEELDEGIPFELDCLFEKKQIQIDE